MSDETKTLAEAREAINEAIRTIDRAPDTAGILAHATTILQRARGLLDMSGYELAPKGTLAQVALLRERAFPTKRVALKSGQVDLIHNYPASTAHRESWDGDCETCQGLANLASGN